MITSLIKRIAQELDAHRIPYMVIGGQAVLLYGRARLTRDIDITLGVDVDQFARVEQVCESLGLEPLAEKPREFVTKTKVLPVEAPDTKLRVDFVFSFTPYETQAIGRANEVLLEGRSVKFASCEDVIIHKMVAGRPVDQEDVRHLVAKNRESIDTDYVRHWLSEFSQLPDHSQIVTEFDALWRP